MCELIPESSKNWERKTRLLTKHAKLKKYICSILNARDVRLCDGTICRCI